MRTHQILNKIFKLIILGITVLSCNAFADTNSTISPVLTLNDAVLIALRSNPDVQSGEIQRTLDKFNLKVAEYAFQWQFGITSTVNYATQKFAGEESGTSKQFLISPTASITTPLGTQFSLQGNAIKTTNYNPGITASIIQPLLQGFGPAVTLAPLYNAYDQETINKLSLKNTIMTTITGVITDYRSLVEAENNLTSVQLGLKNYEDTVKQNQALIAAGSMAPSDLVEAQAQVATQKVSVQAAINSVIQAKQTLLVAMGLDPNTPINVPEDIVIKNQPIPDIQKSVALALANDPTYQSQLFNLKILGRELVVAHNAQLPTLDIVANASLGNGFGPGVNAGTNSIFNGQNTSTNVGLQLNIPIDNLNNQQQEVSAKVALDQGKIALENLKRQITSNVIASVQNIQISLEQAQQAEEALVLNKQTVDIAVAKQKYGRASTFEVVSMAANYNNAMLEDTNDKINYLNALTSYDQIVGTTLEQWHIQIRY